MGGHCRFAHCAATKNTQQESENTATFLVFVDCKIFFCFFAFSFQVTASLDLLDLSAQLLFLLWRKRGLEAKELANASGVLVLDEERDVLGAHLEQLFHLQIVGGEHQSKQRVMVQRCYEAFLKPF